jgi:hypothetical protein
VGISQFQRLFQSAQTALLIGLGPCLSSVQPDQLHSLCSLPCPNLRMVWIADRAENPIAQRRIAKRLKQISATHAVLEDRLCMVVFLTLLGTNAIALPIHFAPTLAASARWVKKFWGQVRTKSSGGKGKSSGAETRFVARLVKSMDQRESGDGTTKDNAGSTLLMERINCVIIGWPTFTI